jgi:tetratricopeptide (TPR) repeat protein
MFLRMFSESRFEEESVKLLRIQDLIEELAKQDRVPEVLAYIEELNSDSEKFKFLFTATNWLFDSKLIASAEKLIKQCQEKYTNLFRDCYFGGAVSNMLLIDISLLYAQLGMFEQAIEILLEIKDNDEGWKCRGFFEIVNHLVNQERCEEAIRITGYIQKSIFRDRSLKRISIGLIKQAKYKDSIAYVHAINDRVEKCSTLSIISTELAKQGLFKEARYYASEVSEVYEKSSALKDLSIELVNQGLKDKAESAMQDSLACAREISDLEKKSRALREIAAVLRKQGQEEESALLIQESINIAYEIRDDYPKNQAFREITAELIHLRNWEWAEKICLEIPQITERHECWESIAMEVVNESNWQNGLESYSFLNSKETQLIYLKGWVNTFKIGDVSDECVREALPILAEDPESIEALLQKYAAREVALGNPSNELISRLNRTLNIQWLLDITAQFSKQEAGKTRFSTNLSEWLHEIADEDDREQIELWAKQVTKGKISEEEFGQRMRGLM